LRRGQVSAEYLLILMVVVALVGATLGALKPHLTSSVPQAEKAVELRHMAETIADAIERAAANATQSGTSVKLLVDVKAGPNIPPGSCSVSFDVTSESGTNVCYVTVKDNSTGVTAKAKATIGPITTVTGTPTVPGKLLVTCQGDTITVSNAT